MSELALAAFAAASDAHLVEAPRAPLRRLRARFDEEAERRGSARSAPLHRSHGAPFPPLLAAIHDPPPGLFLRGDAELGLLSRRPSRSSGPAPARPTAAGRPGLGRELARPASSSSAGSPAASTARRTAEPSRRGGNRRSARLWHRPRLSGRARRAGGQSPRRPDRLGVRAGCRAGSVALPGAKPHRRRALCGHRRGGGTRAERRPDHGRLRARGGREVFAVPGEITQRCPPARTPCCGSERRPTCDQDVLETWAPAPGCVDRSRPEAAPYSSAGRAVGADESPGDGARCGGAGAALTELELRALRTEEDGGSRAAASFARGRLLQARGARSDAAVSEGEGLGRRRLLGARARARPVVRRAGRQAIAGERVRSSSC